MICEFCQYEYPDALGRYGCPNCEGEGTMTTNPKDLSGATVQYDSDTWRVLGVGTTREDGATMFHLASTSRGRQQKNGWYPAQICAWIHSDEMVRT